MAIHLTLGVLLIAWLTDITSCCPYGYLWCPILVSRTNHFIPQRFQAYFVKAAGGDTDASVDNVPDNPQAQALRTAWSATLFPGKQQYPSRELSRAEGTRDFVNFQEESHEDGNARLHNYFPDKFAEPHNMGDTVLDKGYNQRRCKIKVFPKGTFGHQSISFDQGGDESHNVLSSIHQPVIMPRGFQWLSKYKKKLRKQQLRTGKAKFHWIW